MELYQDHENPFLTIIIMIELLGLQVLQGKLRQVIATSKDVIQLSGKYSRLTGQMPSTLGFAYARLSYALREQNQIEPAIFYAQEAVKISRKWGQKDSMAVSYLYLAYALHAAGYSSEASEAVEKCRQASMNISRANDAITAACQAKLHYLQGDLAFITEWVRSCGLSVKDDLPFNRFREYLTFARALTVQKKFEESLSLLQHLLSLSADAGANLYVVENLVLQALVLQELGEDELALAPLEQALELAEPEGFVRSFVDEGEKMIRLLRMAARRGHHREYAVKLLEILDSQVKLDTKTSPGGLGNLLTLREEEILRMLSTGMPVTQIADELCIAVSTLRTHIRNIYEKLGIHSRVEAAVFAKELTHT
jgi:LuxR family maltose regulon positive regulatory protein